MRGYQILRRIITVCIVILTAFFSFMNSALAAPVYSGELKPYSVLLIDADSGAVLVNQNENEQIEPASTTKIMTCILALESKSLDDEVTISGNAAGTSGSSLDLVEGEVVKMGDLLSGMMMESGNDAATAVAEFVGGDVETFVGMMNAKAQVLGMAGTHFANPHGKHSDDNDHYSTATDMGILARYAMTNPKFTAIVDQESYTMPATNKRQEKTYNNTCFLMRSDKESYYPYATGGKTGSTEYAGACLVAMASNDEMDLICLIFKDESTDGADRWSLAKSLFDFGFNSYSTVDVQTLLDKAAQVQVQIENYASSDESDGLLEFVGPQTAGTFVTLDKTVVSGILDGTDTVQSETAYSKSLQAPVLKGDVLGTVTYKSASTGEELYSGSLIASRDVLQAGAEPDASGGTAVTLMDPIDVEELKTDPAIYYWLLIPGALIVFLVVRLLAVNKRKRKRFNKRRPHYSYRIK